eukprot:TRINITY_DN714_c0_g1_i2.p1 TRINITY_DN714_c0_g1~~TRINITY_DN714_c0_g1_i2.p1  ORF type:complete len:413 (+),score=94.52 TRINITY_DN714_c0_g1_i2:133-1371(+)
MQKILVKIFVMALLLEKISPQEDQQQNYQTAQDSNSQSSNDAPILGTTNAQELTTPSEFSTGDQPTSPQKETQPPSATPSPPNTPPNPPPPLETIIVPIPEVEDDKIENLPKPYRIPLTFRYRETIFGQRCVFPFTFEDKQYIECYESPNGKEYCLMPNNALYVCASLPDVQPVPMEFEEQFTVSGKKCQLPVLHRGTVLQGCLNLTTNEKACYNGEEWEECGVPPSPPPPPPAPEQVGVQRLTKLGLPCEFPFEYEDKLQFDCLLHDGKEWCQVGDEWQQCAAEEEEEEEEQEAEEEKKSRFGADRVIGSQRGFVDYSIDDSYDGYDYDQSSRQTQGEEEKEGGSSSIVIILVVAFVVLLIAGIVLVVLARRSQQSKKQQQQKKKIPQMSSELQHMPRDKLIEQLAGLGHA